MDDIIQIDIIEKDGHDDLKFSIKDLTANLSFDTYYFGIAAEPFEDFQDVKNCIADFIKQWVTQIEKMQDGQTKYFPIDISDQYTGCLKIDKQSNKLKIAYGTSRQEGWGVNINDPSHYFDNVTDFRSDIPKTIVVPQADFLTSLKKQIYELTN